MTKAEIYEKAEAEGKEVRMCNGLGCTALGFKGDVHWMSQARKVAEGRTEARPVCGRYRWIGWAWQPETSHELVFLAFATWSVARGGRQGPKLASSFL